MVDSLTPSRASLPESVYIRIFKELEPFKPRAIGLDIYRDFQTKDYVNKHAKELGTLFKHFRNDSRLFVICEVPDTAHGQNGAKSPHGVPIERVGFNDVILDPEDEVIRRHLVKMDSPEPTDVCDPKYALSFQLARHYLEQENITIQQTVEGYEKIGNAIFKPINKYSGGYQNIDDRGTQVLLNYRTYGGSTRRIVPQITLEELFEDKDNKLAQKYKDRIVLIGFIDQPEDYSKTPFDSKLPGLFIHAQMVSQILSAADYDEKRPLLWVWSSSRGDVLWILCWCLLGGGLGLWLRSLHVFLLSLVGGVLTLSFICRWILISSGGWVPLVPPGIGFVTTGTIILGYNKVHRSENFKF